MLELNLSLSLLQRLARRPRCRLYRHYATHLLRHVAMVKA
jgi:hypothetical protein